MPNASAAPFDDHTKPHREVTNAQATFFLAWAVSIFMWLLAVAAQKRATQSQQGADGEEDSGHTTVSMLDDPSRSSPHCSISSDDKDGFPRERTPLAKAVPNVEVGAVQKIASSGSAPVTPTVEQILRSCVVFGAIMLYFFLCDYVKIFPVQERQYSRDVFLFILFVLFLIAGVFTLSPCSDKILNRDQTEEWKGWMQVMFVWYHYFAAKEWYNWIRVYIACYVWMTGFGNFSFFWVRGDYSLWRVLKMLFRMNFLVIAVIMATANEYMLYYICAMHTYWFLTVYAFMRSFRAWNTQRHKMAAKFAVYFLCNALVFEMPGVCTRIFRPLWFVFQFHDGVHDVMHEWEFRAGLDHWACFVGMLCAYNYPHFEAFIKYLETDTGYSPSEHRKKLLLKASMICAATVAGFMWYFWAMTKDKFSYNETHCYSSLVPILVYIVLRNSFPVLRRHNLALFGHLGKITLETYLSQLHVYLQSNAKHLIQYIPGYMFLNFALATIIYLIISRTLFDLTLQFSEFFIRKDWKTGAKMACVAGAVLGVSAASSFAVLHGTSVKL